MARLKRARSVTIDGNVFVLSGREVYDEEGQIVGVKCQHCEFEKNPLGSHYCGVCGQNIAADDHVWEAYDSTSCSIYKKYGNRVISEKRFNEYERYEKIVKTNSLYVKVGGTVLLILAILVGVVIMWFFPELCGEETAIYKQGTANLVELILGTIMALVFVALFGFLIKMEIKDADL